MQTALSAPVVPPETMPTTQPLLYKLFVRVYRSLSGIATLTKRLDNNNNNGADKLMGMYVYIVHNGSVMLVCI